jgi:hypothetical protein
VRGVILFRSLLALIFISGVAEGASYEVGPTREYKSLQEVSRRLGPGDVVTVDGGVSYPGGVSLDNNGMAGAGVITVKGTRLNGERPMLAGGLVVMRVRGSHYVIEGFDLSQGKDPGTMRCFYNVGDDVTLRDSVVHDCHFTGIAGADAAGSLTLDGVEVCRCGVGLFAHQIYVGSSLAKYPEAVFRMQYCYVHDGMGGNNVKSRVTRNEIEYNWIEGASFHELDLVGPDPKAQKTPASGVHCDGVIIGNVLMKSGTSMGTVARLGSDGTGSSCGRYVFAYNTVIVRTKVAAGFGLFWMKGEVDSVGMWNNVFWSEVGPMKMTREETGTTPVLAGDGNWVPVGTIGMPAEWKAMRGKEPGFVDAAGDDFRPQAGSALIGAGCVPPGGIVARGTPPAPRSPMAPEGVEAVRPESKEKDIGAYPFPRGGGG